MVEAETATSLQLMGLGLLSRKGYKCSSEMESFGVSEDLGCGSEVEHLLIMCEGLGSFPRMVINKKRKERSGSIQLLLRHVEPCRATLSSVVLSPVFLLQLSVC